MKIWYNTNDIQLTPEEIVKQWVEYMKKNVEE